MDYGQRLRDKRKEKGLTQEQLADQVSTRGQRVTSAYVSMIERGYDRKQDGEPSRPNRRFVELAAEVLDDDVDEALMDADYAPRHRERLQSDPSGLYSGLHRVPAGRRELAERQIRAIIESLVDPEEHATQND